MPNKPQPPRDGSPSEILRHAADYGAYVKQLEQQLNTLREWSQKIDE